MVVILPRKIPILYWGLSNSSRRLSNGLIPGRTVKAAVRLAVYSATTIRMNSSHADTNTRTPCVAGLILEPAVSKHNNSAGFVWVVSGFLCGFVCLGLFVLLCFFY